MVDVVAGHYMCSILDGFLGSNHIKMHLDDENKTAFIANWGEYVLIVMNFGLKNGPPACFEVANRVL